MNHNFPKKVRIIEVGPRDGLQSEPVLISKQEKIELINRLNATGLSSIEVGSFVSPKWVPQMADSANVFCEIEKVAGIDYPMLVPNKKGLETALDVKASHIAVFAAASETFSQKNINCTIAESLQRYEEVITDAVAKGLHVRGYVSCVVGCPYEGEIAKESVVKVANALFDMGCEEVALGDTIGVGTPLKVEHLLNALVAHIPIEKIGVHFHDTYGQALANCLMALSCGVTTIDSAVAGLGGCPYAKGASGNLATEDLVYLLHGMGIETGVDETKLLAVTEYISSVLKRAPMSKVALARMGSNSAG